MSDVEFEGVIPEGGYGAHQVELSHTDKAFFPGVTGVATFQGFFQTPDNAAVAMQVGRSYVEVFYRI
jgi:hypothetical protein